MNGTRRAKRFFLIVLLSVIMLLSIFAGTLFYTDGNNFVMAETVEVIDSEAVKKEQTSSGVRISSNTAYEAKIAGVFKGNSSVTFNLDGDFDSWSEQGYALENIFNFRIASVVDPTVYFDVAYTYLDDYDWYYKYNVSYGTPWGEGFPYIHYSGEKTGKDRLFGPKLSPILYYSEREPGSADNTVKIRYGYDSYYYREDIEWETSQNKTAGNFVARAIRCYCEPENTELFFEWDDNGVFSVYYTRAEAERTKPVDAEGYPLDSAGNRNGADAIPSDQIYQFYKTDVKGDFLKDSDGNLIPAYYEKVNRKFCLAKFDDGKYNCYLPNLDILKSGYTITLMSDCPYVSSFKRVAASDASRDGFLHPYDNETGNLETSFGITLNKISDGETEIDLSSGTYEQKGAFEEYTNFISGTAAQIYIVDDYALNGIGVGNSFVVPKAVYAVNGESNKTVTDVKIGYGDKCILVACGDLFTPEEAGEHRIIYTVGSASKSITIDVCDNSLAIDSLLAGKNISLKSTSHGILFHHKAENYEAEICGEFNGEFSLTFSPTVTSTYAGIYKPYNTRLNQGDVITALKVESNSGQTFYVVISCGNNSSNVCVAYEYRDNFYYRGYAPNSLNSMTDIALNSTGFAPFCVSGQDWLSDATISFSGDRGGFKVEAIYNRSSPKKVLLAQFDGTFDRTAVNGGFNSGKMAWGLPAFDYESGYTVSFVPYSDDAVGIGNNLRNDLLIRNINGVDFAGRGGIPYTAAFDVKIKNSVEKDGTIYIPQGAAVSALNEYKLSLSKDWNIIFEETTEIANLSSETIGSYTLQSTGDYLKENFANCSTLSVTKTVEVQKSYTIAFDTQGGTEEQPLIYSESTKELIAWREPYREYYVFLGWFLNGEFWNGNLNELYGKNVVLTAKWSYFAYPDIRLKTGLKTSYVAGEKFTVSFDDLAVGEYQKNLSFLYTVVFPNGNEINFRNGSSIILQTGNYRIIYSAMDEKGFTATINREFNVAAASAPTIKLSDRPITTTIVGKSVLLPLATAVDSFGNVIETVNCFVTYNDKNVEITNGSFLAENEGEYKVSFVTKDVNGTFGYLNYTIQASADETAPSIVTDYADCEVKKGSVVILPNVSAFDDVDETVTIKISVYYGTEKVETASDNSFTASETGVYRIVIEAFDSSMNRSVKTFTVIVPFER